jgi:hypothetical protein
MLAFNSVRITHRPWMNQPLEYPQKLYDAVLSDFNYDGFILVPLEKDYYIKNEIELNVSEDTYTGLNMNNHWPLKQPWLVATEQNPNLFVNSSYLYTRYGYTGRARYELEKYSRKKPELVRLLEVKPKWAITMNIEWIDERGRFELLNYYREFNNTEYLQYIMQFIKDMLVKFDWYRDCKILADLHTEWKVLNFKDRDNYKRSYFGLNDV